MYQGFRVVCNFVILFLKLLELHHSNPVYISVSKVLYLKLQITFTPQPLVAVRLRGVIESVICNFLFLFSLVSTKWLAIYPDSLPFPSFIVIHKQIYFLNLRFFISSAPFSFLTVTKVARVTFCRYHFFIPKSQWYQGLNLPRNRSNKSNTFFKHIYLYN